MPAQLSPPEQSATASPTCLGILCAGVVFVFGWLARRCGVAGAVNALKARASGVVFRCCMQEGVLHGRRSEGVQAQITQWIGGQDRIVQHR